MTHPIVVTIVCDGHRPDFVDEALTPAMAAVRRSGTWFADHRGIFPSATRTSSASIATGCHPAGHGLLGNTMAFKVPGGFELHDAGKPEFYDAYIRQFGRSLARPAVAERVAGLKGALICSNASPGAAFFHDAYGHAEFYHREICYGPGRVPTGVALHSPAGAVGDALMTDRFIALLPERLPSAATLWFSDPDKTMHAYPLGSPEHLKALDGVDRNIAKVSIAVDRLRDAGHDVLFIIASDHGHEAVTEVIPVERRLHEAGFKREMESPELIVSSQGSAAFIHFDESAMDRRAEVAQWLGEQSWIEAVIDGEDLPRLGQPASPDVIAIDMKKTEGTNIHGVPGLTAMAVRFSPAEDDIRRHCGMHGGLGPYETRPTLIVSGGGFGAGVTVEETSSITDIAPTVLAFLGLAPDGMDGKVLPGAPPR